LRDVNLRRASNERSLRMELTNSAPAPPERAHLVAVAFRRGGNSTASALSIPRRPRRERLTPKRDRDSERSAAPFHRQPTPTHTHRGSPPSPQTHRPPALGCSAMNALPRCRSTQFVL